MPLPVRFHTASPKFAGVSYIGNRIFDLSIVAKIPAKSPVHSLITSIQEAAQTAGLAVYILPANQTHITILNPVFKMEPRDVLPEESEQLDLFEKFVKALKTGPAQRILQKRQTVNFTEILFRQRDLKLWADDNPELVNAQSALEAILEDTDGHFDFAEGLPASHNTILRFTQEFDEANYAALQGIVEKIAGRPARPLILETSLNNLLAVRFPGLFTPWQEEADLVPIS